MSSYTQFESEMLKMMGELKSDVSELKSDVSELKTSMTEVKGRLISIEDAVVDLRQEMTDEWTATRALLGQAFEHISDQMASKDHAIQPSLIFRHSRSRTRTTV